MPGPKKRQEPPLTIRVTPPLRLRIQTAADRLGISFAEAIRLAVGIGLERLRRIDYDVDGAINDAVDKTSGKPEAPASKGGRPGAAAGGRSSGSTATRPVHGTNEGDQPPAPRITSGPDAEYGERSAKRSHGS